MDGRSTGEIESLDIAIEDDDVKVNLNNALVPTTSFVNKIFKSTIVGMVSSLFRIFWGGISDRIGREITFTMGMFCACMGVLSLILMIHIVEPWCVYLFMGFFGAGWGATAPMFMAAATDIFKGRIFGLIYGIVEAGIGIAGAFGSWIGGFVYDRTQSYQWAFVIAFAAFALACFFMWFAAPRKSNPIKTP